MASYAFLLRHALPLALLGCVDLASTTATDTKPGLTSGGGAAAGQRVFGLSSPAKGRTKISDA